MVLGHRNKAAYTVIIIRHPIRGGIIQVGRVKAGIVILFIAITDLAANRSILAIARLFGGRAIPVIKRSPPALLVRATRLIQAILTV